MNSIPLHWYELYMYWYTGMHGITVETPVPKHFAEQPRQSTGADLMEKVENICFLLLVISFLVLIK